MSTGASAIESGSERGDRQGAERPAKMVARRRIGGTIQYFPEHESESWHPTNEDARDELLAVDGAVVPVTGQAAAGGTARIRRVRRRRRRWYRRPLIVVPLALLMLGSLVGGATAWRVATTVHSLRQVSTPPPEISVLPEEEDLAALGADAAAVPVVVDTSPAQAAVAESGFVPEDGGGGFGRIRSAASEMGDLAAGAAVAAGVGTIALDPMTILVMGVDAQPGEPIDIGVRPDVLMVLRLDPVAGECRLLSVPRDTRTELPGYGETKVNHALMIGGIPYQMLVVEELLEISLDRYLLIDFTGFKDLVDAVGGIEVNVPSQISRDGQVLFPAGLQTFDGDDALNYARYRDTTTQGDAGRIKRQWSILRGLGDAVDGRDLATTVTDLLPAVEDHLRTDLSTKEMVEIAKAYGDRCTPETVEPAMLDGFRVDLQDDPIFHMTLTYNVVEDAKIEERVAVLMGT